MVRSILVRPFELRDQDAVIRLWNETKRVAYPYLPLEVTRTISDDTSFFTKHLAPRCDLWVACDTSTDQPLGFLALERQEPPDPSQPGYLDRLYIQPSAHRSGVGTALLKVAFDTHPHGLRLHTHQANVTARAFYEKHGFVVIALGVSPPPESAPDVEYAWKPA